MNKLDLIDFHINKPRFIMNLDVFMVEKFGRRFFQLSFNSFTLKPVRNEAGTTLLIILPITCSRFGFKPRS
ncbi:hypothetical protein Hanom_Chr10g00889931 [Helianthus anomalus]